MAKFEPHNVDLISVFEKEVLYEVPRFQRGYDWGKEQIENFWADLESVNQKGKDSLFFGSFIFLRSSTAGDTLSIIDGQQRITTLQILFIAIRVRAKILNDDPLLISNVTNLIDYVANRFARAENTGIKKLTPAKGIKPLYDLMSDYKWDGHIPDKIEGLDGRRYRKMKRKVEPVFHFLHDKVKSLSSSELAEILNSLQRIFVTEIKLDDPQEAFDIFERTNARGVKLAQSDLVKNLLFQNSKESLHDEIDQKWDQISANSSDKLSQMLKYYTVTFNGKTLRKDIFPKLNVLVKGKSTLELVENLLRFSFFYRMMLDEDITFAHGESLLKYFEEMGSLHLLGKKYQRNPIVRSISAFQLFGITQLYPLIYTYLEALKRFSTEDGANPSGKKSSGELFICFIKRLENFHFINTVIGGNIGNQVETLYAEYAKAFSDAPDFATLIEKEQKLKTKLLELRNKRKSFISQFSSISSDEIGKPLTYYIFDRLANAESQGDQIYPLYVPSSDIKKNSANIEHFYPRSLFQRKGDLVGPESGDNIGNLLVISMHSNSSFNDATPEEKFAKIDEDGKWLANLGNSKRIITQYKGRTWDKELIDKRAMDLAQYAYDTAWSVDIS
ncbi:MAG: DUF262 domain-containing protein [Candidatus Pacebacteria bacterium]|nr:DUF262 domain-containing protein [Candidatus Paceibacterota bacterium]